MEVYGNQPPTYKMKRRQNEEAPIPEEIKRSRLQPSPKESPLDQYQRRRKWRSWSVEEVSAFLLANEFPEDVSRKFERHQIAGRHLQDLTEEDLEKMEIFTVGLQKDILHLFKSLREQKILGQEKVFNDPIHGHIELHPLMVRIIDTPQFQRLRSIKQLGGGYYVFPGASHNRFEHSIGVGYLAGELVETLQRKQPELRINEKDVLCVKIAGLCHDLGHGPFSHMFDGHFIPEIRPDKKKKWKHEQASVMMFDHMIEVNNLRSEFMKHDLEESDIVFIKEQIAGPLESEMCSQQTNDWSYQGRDEAKSFLYEIVANKRNGIDVDKWDYFARDCHCLGIPNNFDMKRYMKFARVLHVNNRRQICTRDKEVGNLYEMFHTRSSLHRRAYQHKTCNIIEHMITEALKKADEHLLLPDKDGIACVRMSEAIENPYAYTRLTDHVIQQILMSTTPELEESRQLLQKVERRELYKYVGQTQLPPTRSTSDISGLAKEIVGSLLDEDADSELEDLPRLTEDDILVNVVTFDYGKGDEDPIDHVRFYRKDNPEKPVIVRKDQVSQMLPQSFRERHVRIYCKKLDQPSLQAARKYFIAWGQKQSCITPQLQGSAQGLSVDLNEWDFTPYGTPYSTPVKNQQQGEETRTPLNSEDVVKKLKFVNN